MIIMIFLLLIGSLNAIDSKDVYNNSLKSYLDYEDQYRPIHGNGKLYYNIGNSYYRLGEYPLAILYYYKSLALMPGNRELRENLNKALEKQQLPLAKEALLPVPTPEQFRILFGIGIIFMVLLYIFAWNPTRKLKVGMVVFGVLYLSLLGELLYSRYFEPLHGVLIRAASVYKDAGKQYAKATPDPLPAGLKVDVLDVKEEGQWLKIMSPDGVLGYVHMDSIRIL